MLRAWTICEATREPRRVVSTRGKRPRRFLGRLWAMPPERPTIDRRKRFAVETQRAVLARGDPGDAAQEGGSDAGGRCGPHGPRLETEGADGPAGPESTASGGRRTLLAALGARSHRAGAPAKSRCDPGGGRMPTAPGAARPKARSGRPAQAAPSESPKGRAFRISERSPFPIRDAKEAGGVRWGGRDPGPARAMLRQGLPVPARVGPARAAAAAPA